MMKHWIVSSVDDTLESFWHWWYSSQVQTLINISVLSCFSDCSHMLQHAYFVFKMRASLDVSKCLFCVLDASFSDCFQMLQHAYFVFKMRASLIVFSRCSMLILCSRCELLWVFPVAAACLFCVQDASFSDCFQLLQHAYFVFKMRASLIVSSCCSMLILCSRCELLRLFPVAAACLFCVQDASFSECFQLLQHAFLCSRYKWSRIVDNYFV